MFIFMLDECLEYTGYKSKKSVFIGLGELVENEVIGRSKSDAVYCVNPLVAFNSDRVTFAKSYVKKRKPKGAPAQLKVFEETEEKKNHTAL